MILETIIMILGIYSFTITLIYFLDKPKIRYIKDNRVSIGFIFNGIYFLWNGDRVVTSDKNNNTIGNFTIWNRGLDEVETKSILNDFKKSNKN